MKRSEKKTKKKTNIITSLHQELAQKPVVATIYITLRVLVILTMVLQFFNRNFENVFLCGLTLILFLVPTMVERRLKIELPNTLEIIILLFIFSAEILGEIQSFYTTYQYWDTILHTLNGFLAAAVGFCLVDVFNRHEKFSLSLSPIFMTIVAFCFSMTIGVLWEFFEWGVDMFLLLDMQKDTVINTLATVNLDPSGGTKPVIISGITDVILVTNQGEIALGLGGYLDIGLMDTMKDMLVNLIGAVVFSVVGYFYVKSRGQGDFARRFIPQVADQPESQDSDS